MKVLIVDDEPSVGMLFTAYLNDYGHCDVAINGYEAIDLFTKCYDEGEKYDLICLDIMMPNMSGREVLKKIRKFEEEHGINALSGVKVLMVTAKTDSKSIIGSFYDQCEGYLKKPIERDDLVKAIKDLGLLH